MDHSEVFFCSHWTAMDPWLPPRSSDVNAVECALINETVKNNSNPLIPPLTAAPDTFYCCGAEGSIRRRFHGILTGCSRRQMSPKGAGERLRDQFYVLINNLYLLYFSLRVSLSIWKASHTVCTEAWFEWEQSCNSWSMVFHFQEHDFTTYNIQMVLCGSFPQLDDVNVCVTCSVYSTEFK